MSKPTVHDIAREAGVSLATVDRVLNTRPGVRAKTVERVQEAIQRLGYVRDTSAANLARKRLYRFVFVLPDGKGQFLSGLRRSIAETAAQAQLDRTEIRVVSLPTRDHVGLVRTLDALDPAAMDGLAIMANETPVVRDTIARMKSQGVAVAAMVADQPNSGRDHYVGVDNVAAGRTAGELMGRFVGPRSGSVLTVATTMQARDMIERRLGFDAVLTERFPHLRALPSIEAHDAPDLAEKLTQAALLANPDAVGLYSLGASVTGIAQAVRRAADPHSLVCINHELTANSRALLTEGLVDVVITQNTGHLARSALRVLRAFCDGMALIETQERIRIEIVMKENLPRDDMAGSREDRT